jgi:O-antigen/teichoic acid export membrane protein
LAVAVTAPLLFVANFSIGVMYVTDAANRFAFSKYRAARVVFTGITVVASAAICLVSRFSWHMSLLVMLTSFAQSIECLSELYRMVMLRAEQMARIAVSLITRGGAAVAAAAVVLQRTHDLVWALVALTAARTLVLAVYDIPVAHGLLRRSKSGGDSAAGGGAQAGDTGAELNTVSGPVKTIFLITRNAFPLTIVTVLTSLVLNMPRYFIEYYAGRRELGLFAAMWSLLTAGNMIAVSMGQAIFPRLTRLYAADQIAEFRQVMAHAVKAGIALGVCSVVCAVLLGKQVLTLAYGPAYAQDRWTFVAIMATGTLLYLIIVFGNVATAARAFRQQALLLTCVAIVTFVASAVLTPRFGVWGTIGAINAGLMTHLGGLATIVLRTLRRAQPAANTDGILSPEGDLQAGCARQAPIIRHRRWFVKQAECWYAVSPEAPDADIIEYLHLQSPLRNSRAEVFETIAIDLAKSEDALFRGMNKTTRNEVRRASTEGFEYRFWHGNAAEAIESFWKFYAEHEVGGGNGNEARRWAIRHASCGALDLSRIARADGTVLAWHAYYRDHRHCRLKYSVSLTRGKHNDLSALIGRANRLHHWEDIRRFKSDGLLVYDLGGWYAGADNEKLLGVNKFKEGFGGSLITSFHCTIPVTTVGRVYLWTGALKARLAARSARGDRRPAIPASRIARTRPTISNEGLSN